MGYCFLHVDKIKDSNKMSASYRHNYRLCTVANADPTKAHLNQELVDMHGMSYADAYEDSLLTMESKGIEQGTIRKDAIKGLEIVLTFSREDEEKMDLTKWCKANIEFLQENFNPKTPILDKDGNTIQRDNVVSAVLHADENGCKHIHALIVPLDDKGKLNGSYYIGSPQKLREMQDKYAEAMKEFGLERGLKGSVATHNQIKQYYAALNKMAVTTMPEILPDETKEQYKVRCDETFQTAQMQWYGKELKLKRQIVESKTMDLNERSAEKKEKRELRKLKNKLSQLLDEKDPDKWEPERIKTVIKQAKSMEYLESKFDELKQDEPELFNKFQEMLNAQEAEERKKREKERRHKYKKTK